MRFFLSPVRFRALLAATVLGGGIVTAQAQPSLLFDVKTGEVLQHQEAFRRWYPASLTKLMTAYVAFRAIDAGELTLQSPIRMTRHAATMPPAKMGFKAGSVLTLDNALKSIMVKSANDVAMAVGENVGGSQEAFAARMNAESRRLGMVGSHWVNPNGLFDPEQYTTAHDLALLVRAIRTEYPQYAPYFNIDGIVVGKTVIKTFNTLMGKFPGADGMKTGFVCPSGFNIIGSATRNGRTLAAVVLGESSPQVRAEHAAELLTAGFAPKPAAPAQPIAASAFAAGAQTPPASTAAAAPIFLATLQPYGENRDAPTDMRPVVCGAKVKTEQSEAPKPPETQAPAPAVVENIGRELRLEKVALGNAAGPVPKAMLDAAGQVKEDVPIPSWRPDLPPPALDALRTDSTDAAARQARQPMAQPMPERFGGSSLKSPS